MQLKIEMYDVKDEMIFDTEEIFAHEIIQEVDGYYCVPVVFEIFDEDENEVATITAYFLDERRIADNGLEISTVADMFSQDLYNAVNTLKKSENYSDICSEAYTCYIETLYVYPMFRGLGIGKYLWENIADIFEYFTNRNIHAMVVYPKPHVLIEGRTNTIKRAIEDDELFQVMKHCLVSNGYEEIEDSNYFMKIYLDE